MDHDEDSDDFWSALEDDPEVAPEGGSEDDFLDTSELTHMSTILLICVMMKIVICV